MLFMRFRFVVLLALLVALLSGCQEVKTIGGEDRTKSFGKIVSLSPSTSELVANFGLQLSGRTKACNYPTAVVTRAPIVGDLKPDYEAITQLGTDLIVLEQSLYSAQEIEKLKQTKAEVFEVSGDTLEEFYKSCFKFGALTGTETSVQDFINRVDREVKVAAGDRPDSDIKGAVVIPGPNGQHMIAGTKSFQADLIKKIGLTPVGPDSNKFEMLNPEQFVSLNPGFIVTAGKTDSLRNDPRFKSVDAIKNLRMVGLDSDIVLRKGARVDSFIKNAHKAVILLTKTNPK